jgi:hypothetical protein
MFGAVKEEVTDVEGVEKEGDMVKLEPREGRVVIVYNRLERSICAASQRCKLLKK